MLLPGAVREIHRISGSKRLRKSLRSMPVIGRRATATNLSAYNSSQQWMNYALLSIMGAYDVLWNGEGQATTNRIWYKLTRLTMGSVLSPSRDHSVLKQDLHL